MGTAVSPRSADRLLDRSFGIPRLSPEAAALFRIVFGVALLWLLAESIGESLDGAAVFRAPGTGYGHGRLAVAHWLRANIDAHHWLLFATQLAVVSFTIGLFTRSAALLAWIGLWLLIAARLVTAGSHDWGAPLIALAGLPLTRLGDAWSIDALLARRRGRYRPAEPNPAYGFAAWWIGFVLGVAFLAAAYAKLSSSGLAWITSGAVGFHFLEDAEGAVVPWGIWIAGRPWLTVPLSAMAILIESALIVGAFCRQPLLRLGFGVLGLSLHLGIYLFQGILWWPWIALYLAFLPWESFARVITASRADRSPVAARGPSLSPVHLLAVVVLISSQVYASTQRIEHEPLLSNYPMYSNSWRSMDEFIAALRWSKLLTYRWAWTDDSGRRVPLEQSDGIVALADRSRIVDIVRALCTGSEVPDTSLTLSVISRRLAEHAGRPVDLLEIVVDIRELDFDGMRIATRATGLHAATLRLSTGTLEFVAPEFNPPCTQGAPARAGTSSRNERNASLTAGRRR